MPWAKLKPFVSNLFRGKQSFDRRQIAHRTEDQTLHSRRQLLTGLGMAGVCAVVAPSLLLNSANAATVIGSGAANLGSNGQAGDAEFEHADINQADPGEAELIETDLDESDLDNADIIDVSRHGRRRRGRRRSSGRGRGRRRARSSRRRRARPRIRRRARPRATYRRRRRRRSYSPFELRNLCRNYYFRRDFPFLCVGVNWF